MDGSMAGGKEMRRGARCIVPVWTSVRTILRAEARGCTLQRALPTRLLAAAAFCILLLLASFSTRQTAAGQAAVPLSRPGQEDLSFWINHNGLLQYEAE